MARVRVVDLARELGMRAGELMFLAEHAGIRTPRVASAVSEEQADTLRGWARSYVVVASERGRQVVRPRAGSDSVPEQVKQRLMGQAFAALATDPDDEGLSDE